jgi:hypothetical protein
VGSKTISVYFRPLAAFFGALASGSWPPVDGFLALQVKYETIVELV